MTRLSITVLQATGLAYLASNTVDAFTPLSTHWNHNMGASPISSASTDSVVLFASTKKKKKSKKRSSGGGGGGFGNTHTAASSTAAKTASPRAKQQERTTATKVPKIQLSAVETARLNTFYTKQSLKDPEVEKKPIATEEPVNKAAIARKTRRQKWSQRVETTESSAEVEQLTALYTEQFQRQQENKHTNQKGQLVQVSSSPLLFTIDEFIDPEACRRVQNDATGCYDLLFPERVSDLLFNGQESEMDGLLFNKASSQEHLGFRGAYPDGLHMDTNNQCLFRHVTCILYLNDIPEECGGATVFPLARTLPDDPALKAAQRLLDAQQSHTRSRALTGLGLDADAQLLEARVGDNYFDDNQQTAIRIQPRAGRLLIFFSRDGDGKEDPRAWHSGERILADPSSGVSTEKRILTLFKEVDYDGNPPSQAATTFGDYLAPQVEEQRKWLQAKAQLQQALLSYSSKST